MGQLILTKNGVEKTGEPPFSLPTEAFSAEFVRTLVEADVHDECFLGQVAKGWSVEEKHRFRHAVNDLKDPEVLRRYSRLLLSWAPVICPNNAWDLRDLTIVYEAPIKASYIDRVIITSVDIRLVETPRGLMTLSEFEYYYGVDVFSHLRAYSASRQAEIARIIEHLQLPLDKKRVMLANQDMKVEETSIAVLRGQPRELWRLPNGSVLLDVLEG